MHLVVDHVRLHTAFMVRPPELPGAPQADRAVADGAIWIRQGTIEAAGPREPVLARAPRGAARLDGQGALALPGFVDSHIHLCEWALSRLRPNLRGCRTAEEVVRRLREAASRLAPSAWLVAGGLEAGCLESWDACPLQVLDRVDPVRPVVVFTKDLHTALANRAALLAAGLAAEPTGSAGEGTAAGHDPDGGRRTGIFREGAVSRLAGAVPQPSPAELAEAVADAQAELWRAGLVGVHVPEGPLALGALGVLRESGRLGIRVWFLPPAGMLDHLTAVGIRQGFGDGFLKLGPLKAFADGSLTSATAALLEPYGGVGAGVYRGELLMDRQAVAELVRQADRAGFSVAIHAIGDLACRETLAGFEACGVRPPPWRPWRMEHVQLLAPEDAARLGRLGVVASVQPIHAPYDRERAERLWSGRSSRAYPLRWIADSGAVLAFGSDAPVEAVDPLKGMYVAVTRRAPPGCGDDLSDMPPWQPEQALSVYEALRAYTWGPAVAVGEGAVRGTLAPGMAGDVVLLSEDILRGDPQALARARVLATILAGEVVHTAGPLHVAGRRGGPAFGSEPEGRAGGAAR